MRRALLLSLAMISPVWGQPAVKDWKAYYAEANRTHPDNAFYQYAVAQTARRQGQETPYIKTQGNRGRWDGQMYEMTTGASAVQETLQIDRLAGTGDAYGNSIVPIAKVQGLKTPSIPFEKLMKDRTSTVEALAQAAPADDYYVHFGKISAMRRVFKAADRWGTHLLSSYQLSSRDNHLRSKIENQLLLLSHPELDPFYDLVIGDLAIVGSDPYLNEGSDCTVILTVKNEALFRGHLEASRGAALAAHPGAATVHETYRDWTVDGIATSDRSVSSYSVVRNGIAIVSNCREALHAVIDTVDGRSLSLAKSPDFKYMRTQEPYDEGQEDAFLFLSDEFVRHVVGPKSKIGEARRVRCQVSLQSIGYAEMMFRQELGRAPATLEDLIESKYLDRASLRCPDGGEFHLEGQVAVCSVHNRLGQIRPNLQLPLEKVTKEEVKAYDGFREGYNAYWRRYIDPVGIRIKSAKSLEVDATILPLVDNSIYSDAVNQLGTTPVSLSRPQLADAVMTFDGKLPGHSIDWREKDLAKLYDRALGDHFSIQVADGAPVLAVDLGGAWAGRSRDWLELTPILMAVTLPTAVVLPVRDPVALEEFLTRIQAQIAEETPNDPWLQWDGYQLNEVSGLRVRAVTLRILVLHWRFFYAVSGDWLIFATDRSLIESLAKTPPSAGEMGALRFELTPAHWKKIAPSMALGYAEDARRLCHSNAAWLEALQKAFGKAPQDLDAESLSILGATFTCPDNGKYQLAADGHVECSLHGTRAAPRQNPQPQPGSPAAYILESIARMQATASFTKEGFHARLVIENKGN